jgi:hypothetical protein
MGRPGTKTDAVVNMDAPAWTERVRSIIIRKMLDKGCAVGTDRNVKGSNAKYSKYRNRDI